MCFDLFSYFFLKLSKIDISENLCFLRELRESPRSSFFLAVIVLPAGLDLSGRIEAEQ